MFIDIYEISEVDEKRSISNHPLPGIYIIKPRFQPVLSTLKHFREYTFISKTTQATSNFNLHRRNRCKEGILIFLLQNLVKYNDHLSTLMTIVSIYRTMHLFISNILFCLDHLSKVPLRINIGASKVS